MIEQYDHQADWANKVVFPVIVEHTYEELSKKEIKEKLELIVKRSVESLMNIQEVDDSIVHKVTGLPPSMRSVEEFTEYLTCNEQDQSPKLILDREIDRLSGSELDGFLHDLGCMQLPVQEEEKRSELRIALHGALPICQLKYALDKVAGRKVSEFLEARGVRTTTESLMEKYGSFTRIWAGLYERYFPQALQPDRESKRVLVLRRGFGFESNPGQLQIIQSAFPRLKICDLPEPGHDLEGGIETLLADVQQYKPDVIIAASRAWQYLTALWGQGFNVPTVLLNVHARLLDNTLPKDVNIVLAHGSADTTFNVIKERVEVRISEQSDLDSFINCVNDDFVATHGFMLKTLDGTNNENVPCGAVFLPEGPLHGVRMSALRRSPQDVCVPCSLSYRHGREALETLVSTGSVGRCFLYLSASGLTSSGGRTQRQADGHNMASLQLHDCLPRLLDSSMSECPEQHMMSTWRTLLSSSRRKGEDTLGYYPQGLQRFWESKGSSSTKLFEVLGGSDEFNAVEAIFQDAPEDRCYASAAPWGLHRVLKIERVENAGVEGQAKSAYDAVEHSLREQSIGFKGGVHVRWLWHGTRKENIASIINDPAGGFSVLAAGRSVGSIWGGGVYFARDAAYLDSHNFFARLPDGKRQVILCLVVTGSSCLGNASYRDLYPKGVNERRYHSLVDSVSSPEIFVINSNGSFPAYVVTYEE